MNEVAGRGFLVRRVGKKPNGLFQTLFRINNGHQAVLITAILV